MCSCEQTSSLHSWLCFAKHLPYTEHILNCCTEHGEPVTQGEMTMCYIIVSTMQIEPLPHLCALSHIQEVNVSGKHIFVAQRVFIGNASARYRCHRKMSLSFLRCLLNQQCSNGNNMQSSVKIPNRRFNAGQKNE